ncbi:MAG: ABC transporter ATP-binding protein, partial [Moraxellaceae bacterium]
MAYEYSGVGSVSEFILLFAGLSLLMIVLSNAVSALTFWVLVRFSVFVGGEMQERLYSVYLNREFIFHKTSNYNRIISMISAEAPRFVYMVLQPFLILVSQLLVAVIIVIGLLAMNPLIAAGSALIIGGSYMLTYVCIKKFLVFHGHRITLRNDWVQRILSESFIGIKDIKLNGLEPLYLARFNDINKKGLNSAAAIALAGDLPRFVIETISFGAIIILAILLLKESQSPGHVVSLLSVYALAGYKLLPTLQQVYKSVSSLSANGSVVHELKQDLLHPITPPKPQTATRLASVEHVVLE